MPPNIESSLKAIKMMTAVSMGINEFVAYDYRPVVLALSVMILLPYSGRAQPTDWELKIDKNGIQIFSRWLESTGEDKVREIKASFNVSATPADLIALLRNTEKATEWMVGAKTFNMLASNGPKSWYAYTEFDLPWPLQNQDLVALYKLEHISEDISKVKVNAQPEYQPAKPRVERMQHFEASWTFRELSNGQTEVTYCAFTYRKPSAPRWVSDPVVQNSLWKTMDGLRALAED